MIIRSENKVTNPVNASSSFNLTSTTTQTQIRPSHTPEPGGSLKASHTLSDESTAMTGKDMRINDPNNVSSSNPTTTNTMRPQIHPCHTPEPEDSLREQHILPKSSHKHPDEFSVIPGNTRKLSETFMASSNLSDEPAPITKKYSTVFYTVKATSSNDGSRRNQIRPNHQDSREEKYPESIPTQILSNLSKIMTENIGKNSRVNDSVVASPRPSGSSQAMTADREVTSLAKASSVLSDESALMARNTRDDARVTVNTSSVLSDEPAAMTAADRKITEPANVSSNVSDSPAATATSSISGSSLVTTANKRHTHPLTASPNILDSSPAIIGNTGKDPRVTSSVMTSSDESEAMNRKSGNDKRVTNPVTASQSSPLFSLSFSNANSSPTSSTSTTGPATRTTKPTTSISKPARQKLETECTEQERRMSVIKETALLFVLMYVFVVVNSVSSIHFSFIRKIRCDFDISGIWDSLLIDFLLYVSALGIIKTVLPMMLNLLGMFLIVSGLYFVYILTSWSFAAITIGMAVLNWVLPAMGNRHWILPTGDRFGLEAVGFIDLLLALIYTAAVFMLATWLTISYDKESLSESRITMIVSLTENLGSKVN